MESLAGKRALVCGASHGIGRACAGAIARLGAGVTVVARDASALARVVAELDTQCEQTHSFLCADFTDKDALAAAVQADLASAGDYQILVNNTGGPASGPLLDASIEALADGLAKHVLAFQVLVKLLVPGMKTSGYGRIVNIISTSVIAPIQGLGVSNTTRGAVANWGRTLAGELAPAGITVNNVLPGFTDTTRLKSLLERMAQRQGVSLADVEQTSKSGIPMGRFASPNEIGDVVAFIASPGASYLTGVNLPIDGGRTAVQ